MSVIKNFNDFAEFFLVSLCDDGLLDTNGRKKIGEALQKYDKCGANYSVFDTGLNSVIITAKAEFDVENEGLVYKINGKEVTQPFSFKTIRTLEFPFNEEDLCVTIMDISHEFESKFEIKLSKCEKLEKCCK